MKLTKKLNQIVKSGIVLSTLMTGFPGLAQTLTLEECYQRAEQLSPLRQQEQYLATIAELHQSISRSSYLPSLDVKGTASYQSDVFDLPFSPPGAEVPEIPKDQYQLTLNLSQKIYDGGITEYSRRSDLAENQVKQDQLDVSLYQIRSVINELYFGILSLKENQRILMALSEEIDNQAKSAESGVANGILLPSVLKSLRKEKLSVQQQQNELRIQESAFLELLGEWLGEAVTANVQLEIPETESTGLELNRPELALFSSQLEVLKAREGLTVASLRPKAVAFATAGYGSPNPYNFFETGWNTYYMVGGRLEWKLWDWNITSRKRQILDLNREIIVSEQENFEKNINNQLIRQQAQIDLLQESVNTDRQLLDLQKEITREAASRLQQGVISSTTYLTELNNQTRAELKLALRQIELAKAKIESLTISGNTP